jgi:transcriptional regulator with XRE-family HTH domain
MSTEFDDLFAEVPSDIARRTRKQAEIAMQLKEILNEIGMSNTELAAVSGLQKSYISRVLAGAANLTIGSIAKLEEAIDRDLFEVPMFRNAPIVTLGSYFARTVTFTPSYDAIAWMVKGSAPKPKVVERHDRVLDYASQVEVMKLRKVA